MRKIIKRIGAKALLSALDKFDELNDTITTYRVKRLVTVKELTGKNKSTFKSVGVLIQGQLVPNVTLGVCRRYKALYPNLKIVFSTWDDYQHGDIQQIEALGISVIRTEKPKHSGPSNINLQIISTKIGLEFLAKVGVQQVLKNRSDGMLSSDYLLEYLQFLFDNYSDNGKRIIVPSYNSFLFRLYSPTDQFQFGRTEVLQKYWSCAPAENAKIEFRFAESYLVREYLSLLGRNTNFTLEDSLSVYRDFFVIADNAELGLVLNKGTKSEVNNRWANDGFPQAYSEIHFWQWLELQNNVQKYLDYSKEISKLPIS